MPIRQFARASVVGLALAMLTGCTDQGDVQQLNQNEFALRGMIASDRQRIDSLQNENKRLQDEIREEITAALRAAEAAAPRPPLETMFTDVFAELPPHLAEQLEYLQHAPRSEGHH